MKMIQVNIWMGTLFPALVDFLRREQPDIITMQEVSGGEQNRCADKTFDTFVRLRDALGMNGVVVSDYRSPKDPSSYFGNAVLTRGTVMDERIVWLKEYREIPNIGDANVWPTIPRCALDVTTEIAGQRIHAIAVHGAWESTPRDTPEKIRQANVLATHLRSLGNEPFILGGDFNMETGSQVMATIDAVAQNAIAASTITNTLNLRIHYAKDKLPHGRRVDFIHHSPHFTVQSISAPEVDVSDHLPICATLMMK